MAPLSPTINTAHLVGKHSNVHYLVREPLEKDGKSPLLILLHGVGSNETDLFSFASQLPDDFLVVSPRGPVELSVDSYAWYQVDFSSGRPVINREQSENTRKTLIDFIIRLKDKFDFDEQKVYLCGFSQGGIMAYSVGLTRPDLVKGVAVISGRLLDEVKPLMPPREKLRHLKIFLSHGVADNVLSVTLARQGNDYLQSLGLQIKYKEHGGGHTITAEILADLVKWLRTG